MTEPKPIITIETWREAPGDFRFRATHPAGHEATGAFFKSDAAARKAAETVTFAAPGPDPDAGAP